MIRLGGRRKNGIQFAKYLEEDSSDDISYLESSGWDHIREWYFVLKELFILKIQKLIMVGLG